MAPPRRYRARFPAWLRLASALSAASPCAAELQTHSYAWLMSNASVVAAGSVTDVSTGFLSDSRKAVIHVDGIIKGRLRARDLEVSWNDKEYEEAAYQKDSRVVVFAVMRKDSTYGQAAPGISCWLVEKVDIKGRPSRAVEYAYPMDLLTGVPGSALRETEMMEKSMNFQMAKRKQWILTDNLLPPTRPLVLPKPPKPKPVAAKKPSKSHSPVGKAKKSLF